MEFIIKIMYLTNIEINQLKKNLMSTTVYNRRSSSTRNTSNNTISNSTAKISDIVSKEIKKIKNGETGVRFEENIRNTLELEYNWLPSDIPRKFYYRQITFNNKNYYISFFIQIDAKDFIIKMDEKNSCLFIERNTIKLEINESKNMIEAHFRNKVFKIYPPMEIELDGVYQNFNYDELDFNQSEVQILFDNTNFTEYDYSIIEIKLNQNKIMELIQQLKADKIIMNNALSNSVVYIGFVNMTKNDNILYQNLDFSHICGDMQCIIFGINNGIFCERNITEPIDWKLVKEFYDFREEFYAFKEEFHAFKEEFHAFKEKIMPCIIEEIKKELKNYIHDEFTILRDELTKSTQK